LPLDVFDKLNKAQDDNKGPGLLSGVRSGSQIGQNTNHEFIFRSKLSSVGDSH